MPNREENPENGGYNHIFGDPLPEIIEKQFLELEEEFNKSSKVADHELRKKFRSIQRSMKSVNGQRGGSLDEVALRDRIQALRDKLKE